jgi:ATP-dependent 26S proteasome regulatory subunit
MPLGSKFAKSKLKKMRWFYFFGPTGTGKTHIIRSLHTECNTLVFDLTPSNIENKYMDKKSIMKLVWMVIIVAKKYQPSIIFFD